MPDMTVAVVAIVMGIALAVGIAIGVSRLDARNPGDEDLAKNSAGLAAGILREIALLGGATREAALEIARARTGWTSLPPDRIDVATWGESYAAAENHEARERLLEAAVTVAMAGGRRIPAAQYSALLALTFALGFHTDALARLRDRFAFEYDDWARVGRPHDADRSGGGAPLFEKPSSVPVNELLSVLGLAEDGADRAAIVSAYRHLAAESHPDRFHDASAEERLAAADRFRELSAAYQALMQVWERD